MNSLRLPAFSFFVLTAFASVTLAQIGPPPDAAEQQRFKVEQERYKAEQEERVSKLLKEKWQVRIDVLMVSAPLSAALEILPSLRDEAKIESACKRLEEMVARKEAKLIAWPEVITKNGERAVTEGILEERYPTEFDPPSPEDGFKRTPKPLIPELAPTAFETRNAGATLEVEPVVTGDGASVWLSLVPQHVRLAEMKTHFRGKNSAGEELSMQQPQFRTMKTTTTMKLRSGQRQLLATFNNETDDTLVFFIVRAVVLPAAP